MRQVPWTLVSVVLLLQSTIGWATLPPAELWREALVATVIGFGKNTTGGQGGTLCRVTTLNNTGAGSLRTCAEAAGTAWIIFDVSGTIPVTTPIAVASNKTIDGRGQNILLSAAAGGLYLNNVSNVILENLRIEGAVGVDEDCIQIMNGSTNVWVDHITFGGSGDEQLYVGALGVSNGAPSGITVSWNHFLYFPAYGGSGAFLISDCSTPQDVATTVTIHHNWYDGTYIRHPLAKQATMHSLNNYFALNEIGAQVECGCQFYSEGDIFEAPYAGAYPRVNPCPACDPPMGDGSHFAAPSAHVKVVNPWLALNSPTYYELTPSGIFTPSASYAYTADTADATLRTAIINGSGWQNVQSPNLTLRLIH